MLFRPSFSRKRATQEPNPGQIIPQCFLLSLYKRPWRKCVIETEPKDLRPVIYGP